MTAQERLPRNRLPATEGMWRLTMEHSPVGMAIVSSAGEFLTANVALCDMLGYDQVAMTQMTFQDITHPEDLDIDLRLANQALAGEISSYRLTKRYICADGGVLVGDLSVTLLRAADGSPIHFISQVADLTERQAFVERLDAVEQAADVKQRNTDALFESVAVGLLQIDSEGNYEAYNRRHQEFLDLAFPDGHLGVAGQDGFVWDGDQERMLSSQEMPTVRAASGETFDDLLMWVGEEPAKRRAVSVSARPVRDRAGSFTGAVLAYHDVTDLIRAVQVKDDFVATVSHELRTPLTSALAYLELLDDSAGTSAEGHQMVTAARRNMLRLSHLVADLLYTTRATAGSPLIDPYRLDIVTILSEAVDAASLSAGGACVQVRLRAPASLMTVADGIRLRQVFDNLLVNATTYSRPDGHVEVTLAQDETHVLLTVSDDGEGIDASEVGEVFERFYRGRNARRLGVPGAGLGLNIVRTVVEAHGGEVSLESSAGRGTQVRVSLPRRH